MFLYKKTLLFFLLFALLLGLSLWPEKQKYLKTGQIFFLAQNKLLHPAWAEKPNADERGSESTDTAVKSRTQPLPSAGSSPDQPKTQTNLPITGPFPSAIAEQRTILASTNGDPSDDSATDNPGDESPCLKITENQESATEGIISRLRSKQGELERLSKIEETLTDIKEKYIQQIRECEEEINLYEKKLRRAEKCETAVKEMSSAHSEFTRECQEFSGGKIRCSSAITACEMCPTEENFGEYDCVRIHSQTKCPAQSGEDLKTAKEKRDKINDSIEELEEKIQESEQDIVEKENQLNQNLNEIEETFLTETKKFERETEQAKAELEAELTQNKAKISQAVSQAMSSIQAKLNESLKISHEFENATAQANRNYRRERRKIVMECESQSQARLARYRQKRKKAIRSGSLQISLSTLLNKKRRSFASIENSLLRRYHSDCLKRRATDFKEVADSYQQSLRLIEQKQEQYQANLQITKQQLAQLNQQATQEQNQLVQSYAQRMNRVLSAHQKKYQEATQQYERAKKILLTQSKDIFVLQRQLSITKQQLMQKQMELTRERELIAYLKSKGVKEDMDEMSQASGALADYADKINIANDDCNCSSDDRVVKKCERIKKHNGYLDEPTQTRYDTEGAGSRPRSKNGSR